MSGNTIKGIYFDTDREVEKQLKEWDIVKCARCGRNVSMLSASHVIMNGREAFIHKNGNCPALSEYNHTNYRGL